ncbi:chaplin [Streptomyces longispororuber]|uniref:chaplin n=1 Tax=Streptomyces longispororuber TaxID=68230 RepID=UPI0036FC7F05
MRQALSKGMLSAAAASSILSLSGSSAFAADASGQAHGSPGFLSGNNVQAPVHVPVNVCGNTADAAAALNPTGGNDCAHAQQQAPHHHAPTHHAPPRKTTPHHPPPHAPDRHDAPDRGPASGTSDRTHEHGPRGYGDPGPGHAHRHTDAPAPRTVSSASAGGSTARSETHGSTGLLSGNSLMAPLSVPLDFCGNTVDVVGVLNPAYGNRCETHGAEPGPLAPHPDKPKPPRHPDRAKPPAEREHPVRPVDESEPRTPSRSVDRAEAPDVAPHMVPSADALAETGLDVSLITAAFMSAGLLAGGAVLYRRGRVTARR